MHKYTQLILHLPMDSRKVVEKQYGNRLRLRVCGICIQGNSLLLVKHQGLGPAGELWIPPGGGMEWGSSAEENLKREFLEETGLKIAVGPLLFVHEHLAPPLHAVELFFEVQQVGGKLLKGADPELPQNVQLIRSVSFVEWEEIKKMAPQILHSAIVRSSSLQDLKSTYGYFKFSV